MNDNPILGLGLIKIPALGWFLKQSIWTSPSQLGLGHEFANGKVSPKKPEAQLFEQVLSQRCKKPNRNVL